MKFASPLLAALVLLGTTFVQISSAHAEGSKHARHRPRANAARHDASKRTDHHVEGSKASAKSSAHSSKARDDDEGLKIRPASVGSPNEGHLKGGAHLDTDDTLRVVPAYARSDNRWGLPELVKMLHRASKKVDHEHPGAVMNVGDLSRRGGGDIDRHHSHESGRDVDVGFYLTRSNGKPLLASRFVPFDEVGRAQGLPGAHFDDERNWSLVSTLLTDPQAHVTHMFVAPHIRARLLAFAEHAHAPINLRNRAAMTLMQPHHAVAHDDHFHVRIACPKSQRGTCIEYATKESRNVAASHTKKHDAKGSNSGKGSASTKGAVHDEHAAHKGGHSSTAGHHGKTASRSSSTPHARKAAPSSNIEPAHAPHSRPTIAKARKRGGSAGEPAPPMAGVVPAGDDFNDASNERENDDGLDEGGQLQITR